MGKRQGDHRMIPAVLILVLSFQGPPHDSEALRRHVVDLGSGKAEVREAALLALKDLPFSKGEELQAFAKAETDPEKRERVKEAIRHLAGKESESLFGEGRLAESLLKLAESQGAQDARSEADRRSALAKEFLRTFFEDSTTPGSRIAYPSGVLAELREKHGRYALPALLASLKGPNGYDAVQLLKRGLGDDVLPFLCGFLRRKDCPVALELCAVFEVYGPDPRIVKALKSVLIDQDREEAVRQASRKALRQLRVIEEEK